MKGRPTEQPFLNVTPKCGRLNQHDLCLNPKCECPCHRGEGDGGSHVREPRNPLPSDPNVMHAEVTA